MGEIGPLPAALNPFPPAIGQPAASLNPPPLKNLNLPSQFILLTLLPLTTTSLIPRPSSNSDLPSSCTPNFQLFLPPLGLTSHSNITSPGLLSFVL